MYKTNSQLRTQAREALSGKWGVAILMNLVITGVSIIFSTNVNENVSISFGSLIGTLLSVLLTVGVSGFMLKICCGQKDQAAFADIIYGFQSHPGKALLLYLLTILYLLPGTLIFALLITVMVFAIFAGSGVSLYAFLYGEAYIDPDAAISFLGLFLVLAIAFFIYALYIDLTYSMIFYVLLDYPDLPTNEIWKRSKQLMKGNRLRLLGLELSFLGWAVLCIFTFGIGFLWLSPYMQASQAAFYLDLVQQQAAKSQNTSIAAHIAQAAPIQTESPLTDQEQDAGQYNGIDKNTFQ